GRGASQWQLAPVLLARQEPGWATTSPGLAAPPASPEQARWHPAVMPKAGCQPGPPRGRDARWILGSSGRRRRTGAHPREQEGESWAHEGLLCWGRTDPRPHRTPPPLLAQRLVTASGASRPQSRPWQSALHRPDHARSLRISRGSMLAVTAHRHLQPNTGTG